MQVDELTIPDPDDDPALLAAMYSGYAQFENWRKVVLAACRELIRASASLSGQKVTEARLEDLSRVHPSYLHFLEIHLRGRVRWERHVQESPTYGR